MKNVSIILGVVSLLFSGATLAAKTVSPKEKADTIYTNGAIYTVNKDQPWAKAVAIKDGRIIAVVGDNSSWNAYKGNDTEVINLDGKMVLPGFIDAHGHWSGGFWLSSVRGRIRLDQDERDIDVVAQSIADFAAAHPDYEWILGGGYHFSLLEEASLGGRMPKEVLDAVIPDRPVFVSNQSGHSSWANSLAMEIAGIDAGGVITPDIYGSDGALRGTVIRDPNTNEATGEFVNAARSYISSVTELTLPPITEEDRMNAIRTQIGEWAKFGITGTISGGDGQSTVDRYVALDEAGELTARYQVAWRGDPEEIAARAAPKISEHIYGDAAKYFVDGSFEDLSISFIDPYDFGPPPWTVPNNFTDEDLANRLIILDDAGVSVNMHSLGDNAVRADLDAISAAQIANGCSKMIAGDKSLYRNHPVRGFERCPRHKPVHTTWVQASDYARFAQYDAIAGQSGQVKYDTTIMAAGAFVLGADRMERFFPTRILWDNGATVTLGSDFSVSVDIRPLFWMAWWVKRVTSDDPNTTIGTGQNLTLEEAIQAYTLNGAYAMGEEHDFGSIEVGKSADMVVVDRNLFEVSIDEAQEAVVLKTIFEGNVVYETQ